MLAFDGVVVENGDGGAGEVGSFQGSARHEKDSDTSNGDANGHDLAFGEADRRASNTSGSAQKDCMKRANPSFKVSA